MKIGSLFSGYGGLDLAAEAVFGAITAWVSDIDPGACKILAHHWPHVPNLGDIGTVDWTAVEAVDVLTGGFPCQDVSHAGKRAGMNADTRSGLWSHMAYAISQLRPRYVIAENVRGLLSAKSTDSDLEPCPWCLGETGNRGNMRALGTVLADLAEIGYDAQWCGIRAADVGAPHGRFRVFILAQDADKSTRSQRWEPAPREEEIGRSWPDTGRRGRAPAADTKRGGRDGGTLEQVRRTGVAAARSGPRVGTTPNAGGERHGRGQDGRGLGPVDGDSAEEARQRQRARQVVGDRSAAGIWGPYAPAIARWETILGRPAPAPTETGPKGGQRLSPRAVEFMMGLPAGHVTDVPGLGRNAQLKALGNGVVPQQAAAALGYMLTEHRAAA